MTGSVIRFSLLRSHSVVSPSILRPPPTIPHHTTRYHTDFGGTLLVTVTLTFTFTLTTTYQFHFPIPFAQRYGPLPVVPLLDGDFTTVTTFRHSRAFAHTIYLFDCCSRYDTLFPVTVTCCCCVCVPVVRCRRFTFELPIC